MVTGFDTALGEITLVLFTTLAPSGVIALMLMGVPVVRGGLPAQSSRRINQCLWIPLVASMVGLVASATHLGNPANALYVFLGVGRSPLSTEVFCAVVFLALSGLYWLYTFVEHPLPALQRAWMALIMAAGVVFVTAVAFAYSADTIISWNTVYVPVKLWLNALVGGPVLAIVGLRAARYLPVEARYGRMLILVALVAFVANTVSFVLQGGQLPLLENAFATAADLVPGYGIMVALFAALVLAGIGADAWALFGARKGLGNLHLVRASIAAALVLGGIFIMRFAFYMMHMTVGLGV